MTGVQTCALPIQQYLEISPERSSDTHGRGIAMANLLSFDNIEYKGNGNRVKVTINTAPATEEEAIILEEASQ